MQEKPWKRPGYNPVNNLVRLSKTFPRIHLWEGFFSAPDRGSDGSGAWAGNSPPELTEDLLDWFEPKKVLDPMVGSGTTKHVCDRYGTDCVALDLNPAWGGFNAVKDEIPCSADLIFWHPPYHNMKVYSGREWGKPHPDDLSRQPTYEAFIKLANQVFAKCVTALRKNGHLVVLVGDIKSKGRLYSIAHDMAWFGKPVNIIPKWQHGASSSRKDYSGSRAFIPVTCEWILIFRKEDCYILPGRIVKQLEIDLRECEKVTWRDVVHAALEKLGGTATRDSLLEEVKKHKKARANNHLREKLRQVLQMYRQDFICPNEKVVKLAYIQ
ncbi:DNA methylase [Thermincola ferriacetica]|uniref:DNA methylase n=1 Tax=Thermincola ferriacetica TaxID=281456 RepID=A0A0L6W450_9FIRM|nr:DNA methyltransferase [Thermincola ferriacetica]KNZ70310.1 DNA methylase [Thermincola ferriacetica]